MNFVIVRTPNGVSFTNKIAGSLQWLEDKRHKGITVNVIPVGDVSRFFEAHTELRPENTLIHTRAAHPMETGWMGTLFQLEERGFPVINSPQALRLTSDKLACSLKLQATIAHPRTWRVNQGENITVPNGSYIAKPQTSMEQGARVTKLKFTDGIWTSEASAGSFPLEHFTRNLGSPFVLQEYVDYSALYRVVVIGGHALPYAFVDKPEFHPDEWKCSVCLSNTMQFVANPPELLLTLAEKAQAIVGAEISFIDIFKTTTGKFTMSEINTACSLIKHERLAKAALGEDGPWNIHYRIAKHLWIRAFDR